MSFATFATFAALAQRRELLHHCGIGARAAQGVRALVRHVAWE